MKSPIFVLIFLLLVSPALAAPWLNHDPVTLSPADKSVTIDVGEKIGNIDNIRFQIDGATVHLDGLTVIPVKGDQVTLRIPQILKSGESSGLINIPGNGVVIKKLKLDYHITEGKPATVTFKIKPD